MLPGGSRINLHELEHVSWVACVLRRSAQHIITADQDLDDTDRDLSDVVKCLAHKCNPYRYHMAQEVYNQTRSTIEVAHFDETCF